MNETENMKIIYTDAMLCGSVTFLEEIGYIPSIFNKLCVIDF